MKLEGTIIWHYDEEDLKAIGIKSIKPDIQTLEQWGFDFGRNMLNYIHQTAETIRYCSKEKD